MSLKYNWDNIDIGSFDVNNSQNFFAVKHEHHEKFEAIFTPQASNDVDHTADNKELNLSDDTAETAIRAYKIDENTIEDNDDVANNLQTDTIDPLSTKEECKENLSENGNDEKYSNNLVLEFSTRPMNKENILMPKHAPPRAYNYKDIYEKKKAELERRRIEEERKMREFRSRPAPKFNKMNAKQEIYHACTVPMTPEVLKHSREMQQHRQRRIEELNRQQHPIKEFRSQPSDVLFKRPFQPKKSAIPIPVEPFKLHVNQRLEERKKFDEAVQQSLHAKLRQKEEEQKRQEEELIKQIRAKATFKARPNPFKGHVDVKKTQAAEK